MPNGFFISGTDTGVGKTVITAALVRSMRARGVHTVAMKPIETGCSRIGGVLYPSDGMFLKKVSGMDESICHITPFCFEAPAAPLVASETEGPEIDIGIIREEFNALVRSHGTVLVEGVGGILVPIRRGFFMIDLIRELKLPLIVVASPFLGTINHTLLTVNYAIKEGIAVSGIIINFSRPPFGTISEQTNPAILERLSNVPVLGTFPYLSSIESDALERAALKHLNIEPLLNHRRP